MRVVWDPLALDDWKRLRMQEAADVAASVERWAATGEGVVYAAGGGEFRLFVGASAVVVFFLDDHADTMHVWQVRRP
jgi:hypothetical protein